AAGRLASRADLQAFSDQRSASGGFWMSIFELVSSHPYLCKRAAALQEFAAPGTVKPVPRNALAYPLAPFLGFAAAGNMQAGFVMVIFLIAFAFAMAVPALKKYQQQIAGAAAASSVHPTDPDEDDAFPDPRGVDARGATQSPGARDRFEQGTDSPAK